MKTLVIALFTAIPLLAASDAVDLYSPQDIQARVQKLAAKGTPFASEQLQKYGNHYMALAYRSATGSAEVHEKESDIFFAVSGDATLVTGGKLVNPHTEKPGELRAASIEGGSRQPLPHNAIVHIPAGVPHQLLIENGKPFAYFYVKVIKQ